MGVAEVYECESMCAALSDSLVQLQSMLQKGQVGGGAARFRSKGEIGAWSAVGAVGFEGDTGARRDVWVALSLASHVQTRPFLGEGGVLSLLRRWRACTVSSCCVAVSVSPCG